VTTVTTALQLLGNYNEARLERGNKFGCFDKTERTDSH